MIEFLGVDKTYPKGQQALKQISFRVEAGEFIFLIGESGAGKSSLIKLLSCEERPTAGQVMLDSFNVGKMKAQFIPILRRKIGMIFQDFRLIDSKTVYENVAFAMEIVGAPKALIEIRVPTVLHLVGLKNRAGDYPSELSGGEAQRIGIARAIINNPRLLLADEPTGNLDVANSEAIMALLQEINKEGATILTCTHDLSLVGRMNQRVIELSSGQLVKDSLPSPIQKKAALVNPFARMEDEALSEMLDLAKRARAYRQQRSKQRALPLSLVERLLVRRIEEGQGGH